MDKDSSPSAGNASPSGSRVQGHLHTDIEDETTDDYLADDLHTEEEHSGRSGSRRLDKRFSLEFSEYTGQFWLDAENAVMPFVFSFLPLKDLARCRMVSPQWCALVDDCCHFFVARFDFSPLWASLTNTEPKDCVLLKWLARFPRLQHLSLRFCHHAKDELVILMLEQLHRQQQQELEEWKTNGGDSQSTPTTARSRVVDRELATTLSPTTDISLASEPSIGGAASDDEDEEEQKDQSTGRSAVHHPSVLDQIRLGAPKQLEGLDLYYCYQLSDRSLKAAGTLFPGLLDLNIGRCYGFSEVAVKGATKRWSLRSLQMSYLEAPTAGTISSIVKNNEALQLLNIEHCSNIKSSAVHSIERPGLMIRGPRKRYEIEEKEREMQKGRRAKQKRDKKIGVLRKKARARNRTGGSDLSAGPPSSRLSSVTAGDNPAADSLKSPRARPASQADTAATATAVAGAGDRTVVAGSTDPGKPSASGAPASKSASNGVKGQ